MSCGYTEKVSDTMKVRRLSRFRKDKEPLDYHAVVIDVTVEDLKWLLENHSKDNGYGLASHPYGKTVYSLFVVPSKA